MLRFSKLTDYAVVVLVSLGESAGLLSSCGLAAATGIPEPTVAKVLKALTTAGLVASQRGARGGYRLARPLSEIAIAAVISAVDGPIMLTACVEHSSHICETSGFCRVRGRWDKVNDAILQALNGISLGDMRPEMPFLAGPQAAAAPQPGGFAPALSLSTPACAE